MGFVPPSVPLQGTCCSILPHRLFHPPRGSLDLQAVSDWLARWDQRSVQTVVSERSSPVHVANIALCDCWTSGANTIENISVTINMRVAVNSYQCSVSVRCVNSLIWPQWHLWSTLIWSDSICLQLHHKSVGKHHALHTGQFVWQSSGFVERAFFKLMLQSWTHTFVFMDIHTETEGNVCQQVAAIYFMWQFRRW